FPKRNLKLVVHLACDVFRDTDAVDCGKRLDSARYVNAIPEDIVRLMNEIANVNADSDVEHRSVAADSFRLNTASWSAIPHSTASRALSNSTRNPSPKALTSRPLCFGKRLRRTWLCSSRI